MSRVVRDCSCHIYKAARVGCEMWIERVDSNDNIADEPSRELYDTLESVGAKRLTPRFDDAFERPDAWTSLSIRHCA